MDLNFQLIKINKLSICVDLTFALESIKWTQTYAPCFCSRIIVMKNDLKHTLLCNEIFLAFGFAFTQESIKWTQTYAPFCSRIMGLHRHYWIMVLDNNSMILSSVYSTLTLVVGFRLVPIKTNHYIVIND